MNASVVGLNAAPGRKSSPAKLVKEKGTPLPSIPRSTLKGRLVIRSKPGSGAAAPVVKVPNAQVGDPPLQKGAVRPKLKLNILLAFAGASSSILARQQMTALDPLAYRI